MSAFLRVDAAIETCSRHLEGTGADPEVEAILAGHVAAIAYASYERRVRELIAERCLHPTDQPINNFANVASQRLVRSIKISELAGFLGFFGDDHKRRFQATLAADSPKLVTPGAACSQGATASPTKTTRPALPSRT